MKSFFTSFSAIIMLLSIITSSYAQPDSIIPVVSDFQVEFTEHTFPDSVNASIKVSYSEAIQIVDSFNVVIRYYSGTWEEYYVFEDTEAAVEENVLTLMPSRSFLLAGRYTIIISAGSLQDLAGNRAGSLNRTFIADENSPIVRDSDITLSFNEANDSVSAVFTVTYNEDVQLNEDFLINTHVFRNGVWDEEYDRYDETEIAIVDSVVTITPSRMFSASERYELVITYASVTDLEGNLSASFTHRFIGDVTPPELTNFVTNFTDSGFADSLKASFTINFNENINFSDSYQIQTYQKTALSTWEVYENVDNSNIVITGNTIAVNPVRLFSETGSYEFVITAGSVRDMAGNAAASFTEVFLRDSIPPKLIDISPDLSLPVPPDASFTFTFDEKVRLITNFIFYTYQWNEDSAKFIVYEKLDSSDVTVEDNVVTFNPSLNFMAAQRAQIVLTAGSVLDVEGNKFLNVTEGDTLTYVSKRFLTADSGVAVVSFLPADGDSISFIPDALTISFSERIVPADTVNLDSTDISTFVYLKTDGLDIEHIAVLDSSSKMIIIEPFMKLSYGTTYTYGFIDGLVHEAAGDSISAMEATFTIIDSVDVINDYAIVEINGDSAASPYLGQVVRITGTITGVGDNGFFVQDENAAGSGIWVQYSDTQAMQVGDGADITGMVVEADGVTSIVADEVTTITAPITVVPVVINFDTDSIPLYQGVLVQIVNARASAVDTAGEWKMFSDEDADSIIIGSRFYAYMPVVDNLYNLAGIVTFRDSITRIEPRFEADILDVTDPTSAGLTPDFDFNIYPNPFGSYIKISNNDRLTRVIISNITGQRIMDISYPEAEIKTSHLISGVYIINLFNENNLVKTSRIIKR